MTGSTPTKIILVHGTFANKASWIEEASFLATSLMEHPDTKTIPFRWTGKNSFKERRNAGEQLAKFILEIHQENPTSRIIIISHSHGGNVVLYAFRRFPKTQKLVSKCVFLGTPFIHYEARKIFRTALDIAGAATLIAVFLLIFILPMMISGAVTKNSSDQFFLQFICAILGVGIGGLGFIYMRNAEESIIRGIIKKQKNIVSNMKSPHLRVPSLICVAQGDEAGAWLATNNNISKITFIISKTLQAIVQEGAFAIWMFSIGLLFALFSNFIGSVGILHDKLADAAFMPLLAYLATALVYYCALTACVLIPHFVRSHPGGFGYEGFLTFALIKIDTSIAPQKFNYEQTSFHHFNFKRNSWYALAHSSFYEDRECVTLIKNWILAEPLDYVKTQQPLGHKETKFAVTRLYELINKKHNTPLISYIIRASMAFIYVFFATAYIASHFHLLPSSLTYWLQYIRVL